jgi:hypothetical protein
MWSLQTAKVCCNQYCVPIVYAVRMVLIANCSRISCIHCLCSEAMYSRGAWILGARSAGQLKFVWWHPVFVGPQYGIFISPFWTLEFLGGLEMFRKFVDLALQHLVYQYRLCQCSDVSSIMKWLPFVELLLYFFSNADTHIVFRKAKEGCLHFVSAAILSFS